MRKLNILKPGFQLLLIILQFTVWISQVSAAGIPQPYRIGGTIIIDDTSVTQSTDDGLEIKVTKQDGSDYLNSIGAPAQDTDGVNASDWYIIDIPIYDADSQPSGANPGESAVIHVYKNGHELHVETPVTGQITVGNSGSITQFNLVASTISQYTLTVTKTGAEFGTVSSTDGKIACGNDCSEVYNSGAVVTLTAIPNADAIFSGWSGGGCTGSGSCIVTLTANQTISGAFTFVGFPNISAIPTSHNFGDVGINTSSSPQVFTISNTGNSNLVMGTLSITGSDASQFIKQNDACSGQTLNPLANCTVQAVFAPLSTGGKSAVLSIPSNDPDSATINVPIDGNGVNPNITVDPAHYSFGNVPLGILAPSQPFTVSNAGTGTLSLGTIVIDSQLFFSVQDDGCSGHILLPASNCTFRVSFRPTATGSYSAQVTIPSNDPEEPNLAVHVEGGSGADLTGNWTTANLVCKETKRGIKCKFSGRLTIRNTGNTTSSPSVLKFYYSTDNNCDSGDVFLKKVKLGKLRAGKTINKSFTYNFPLGVDATLQYLTAIVDADNTVWEAFENNNCIVSNYLSNNQATFSK